MKNSYTHLGDFLATADPLKALWRALHSVVYGDGGTSEGQERLSASAQVLWNVGLFEHEMLNGGVDQFLFNSTGGMALEIIDSLQEIGARVSADIIGRMLCIFPDGHPPQDRRLRYECMESMRRTNPRFINDMHDECMERLFPCSNDPPEEDIDALRIAYMKRHSTERITAQ